jgi:hypothetical protein
MNAEQFVKDLNELCKKHEIAVLGAQFYGTTCVKFTVKDNTWWDDLKGKVIADVELDTSKEPTLSALVFTDGSRLSVEK